MISDDNFEPVETHITEYFGCNIELWRIKGPYWGGYPWRFAITHKGKRIEFTGVPNYCVSKVQAAKRAWWRAKWLNEGTYSARYKAA